MAREKKITVKPFLNKRLKSKTIALDKGELYPLYFQVIYDQKTTRFEAGNLWFDLTQEPELKEIPSISGAIRAIEMIVRYEAEKDPEFQIKGIGKKVKCYLTDIQMAAKLSLEEQINEHLKATIPYNHYESWRKNPIEERVDSGLEIMGEKTPEEIGRLYLLSVLLNDAAGPGLTVFQWLLTDSRDTVIANLEKMAIAQKGRNLVVKTPGGKGFEYGYPLNPTSIAEGFDVMASQIIENNISFSIDLKSIDYDPDNRSFRVEVK